MLELKQKLQNNDGSLRLDPIDLGRCILSKVLRNSFHIPMRLCNKMASICLWCRTRRHAPFLPFKTKAVQQTLCLKMKRGGMDVGCIWLSGAGVGWSFRFHLVIPTLKRTASPTCEGRGRDPTESPSPSSQLVHFQVYRWNVAAFDSGTCCHCWPCVIFQIYHSRKWYRNY